jgi:hypothetical protein
LPDPKAPDPADQDGEPASKGKGKGKGKASRGPTQGLKSIAGRKALAAGKVKARGGMGRARAGRT